MSLGLKSTLGLCLLCFISSPLRAEEDRKQSREPASYRSTETEKNIKDAAPPEPDLFAPTKESESGFDFAVIYKGELNTNHQGGLRQRSVYLENLDLRLSGDLEKIAGLKGGSFFVYALGNAGGDRDASPTSNVGDAQASSNIETPTDSFKVYELWYQHKFETWGTSLLVGLHDLNSEFYTTDTASLFFNSSFGIGKELSQSGVNGPSIFPTTSVAARVRVEPTSETYVQLGIFNAQAGEPTMPHDTVLRANAHDGHLYIAEVGYVPEGLGKIALGGWTYSKDMDRLDADPSAPEQGKSQGVYLLTERALSEGWAAFARYGVATSTVQRFESCVSLGSVWTGLLPSRPQDRFGVGIAAVSNGKTYKDMMTADNVNVEDMEIAYELNYRIELRPGVVLQPDLQYIVNPDTDPSLDDATVSALRLELSF